MRLVIHADDGGLTRGVTENILACSGILSGAAVMAGGECPEYAAEALAAQITPSWGLPPVGVHLNLLEGRAVSPPASIPLLAGDDGIFRHTLGSLWAALTFSAKRPALLAQIEMEFAAQIEKIQQVAGRIYLDGHLHVHLLPPLRPVLAAMLDKYAVEYVRVPAEPRYLMPSSAALMAVGTARRELLCLWSRGLPALLDARNIRYPQYFLGAFCSGALTLPRLEAGLAHVAKNAPSDALVEIMAHPGGFFPEEIETAGYAAYKKFYLSKNRATEKAMLLSSECRALLARYSSPERAISL